MNEYEITLEYVEKKEPSSCLETEYGFGMNPPIVIKANSEEEVVKQLNLSKNVRIKSIEKTS